MPLNKITINTIKDWVIWVTERWSDKTSNNAQSVLNIILTDAFDRGYIKSVPTEHIKLREVEKKTGFC